jgi:hypothetical protein
VAGAPGGPPAAQTLLTGVEGLSWSFYDPAIGWADRWPVEPTLAPPNPAAVRLELVLSGPAGSGRLSRTAPLPAETVQ